MIVIQPIYSTNACADLIRENLEEEGPTNKMIGVISYDVLTSMGSVVEKHLGIFVVLNKEQVNIIANEGLPSATKLVPPVMGGSKNLL